MSNQVYSSTSQKYFASRGINRYGCAPSTTLVPGATTYLGAVSGTQEDTQSTMAFDTDHLVCQVDGMYSFIVKYEYGHLVPSTDAIAASFNIIIDYGVGYQDLAASFRKYPNAITNIQTQYETLSVTIFLTAGNSVRMSIQNNLLAGDIVLIGTNSLVSVQRIV